MSLRQIAKELGVSQSFLSQIRTGKRPLPDSLRSKLEELGAYHMLITDKQNNGGNDWIRTSDLALMKRPLCR
jgi:transcriptional regulator with XRE-family HTH domain